MGYSRELFEQVGKDLPTIEGREPHNSIKSVQNLEAIINEGLRVALMEETPDQSLEVLLKYLGKALNGERTYIFERNESGNDDNTYEWVADGVEPEKENLQNVPTEICASWYRNFSIGKYIVIEDLENIRETDPLQYENLKRQNIHSLVVIPLYDGKKLIGFYGVDNPPVKSIEYASNILQIAAHFIVSSLKRRNLIRELQKRSYNVLHSLSVDYLAFIRSTLIPVNARYTGTTNRWGWIGPEIWRTAIRQPWKGIFPSMWFPGTRKGSVPLLKKIMCWHSLGQKRNSISATR